MDKAEKEELKKVIVDAAHEAANSVSQKQIVAATHATMRALGMDVDNPLELQQDFAHLRTRRMDKENTSKAMKDAAVRWTVTGAFAAIVAWFVQHAPGGS